jgi:hypothetical protein
VNEAINVDELDGVVDQKYRRGISAQFEGQLTDGILWPILQRLQHDDTLSLEVRNGYVDVYYRGGRLLSLRANAGASRFTATFDINYCDTDHWCPPPPDLPDKTIASAADAQAWVDVFAMQKQAMDLHFCKRPKIEREYQQAVVRDNNRHNTGERSDYYVVDVEYAQSPRAFPQRKADYRFDMVGFRWPLSRGARGRGAATPAIMEMKAGDGALSSSCGLAEHVADIEAFLTPEAGETHSGPYRLLCSELVQSFAIKKRLELPAIPKRMQALEVSELSARPQVIFVIANHQPASTVLHRELRGLRTGTRADYYVATVQHAGYALFFENMIPLEKFVADLPEPPRSPRPIVASAT